MADKTATWTETATLKLIQFWDSHKKEFFRGSVHSRKQLWIKAAKFVQDGGQPCSGPQASARWHELLSKYKKIAKQGGPSTNNSFPYYEEMKEVYPCSFVSGDQSGSDSPVTLSATEDQVLDSLGLPDFICSDNELLSELEVNHDGECGTTGGGEVAESEGVGESMMVVYEMPACSWSDEATIMLIGLWDQHKGSIQGDRASRLQAWTHIAETLSASGHKYTAIEAQTRWQMLAKTYREVIQHNRDSKGSHSLKTCPYYTELSEVYDYTPNGLEAAQLVDITTSSSTDDKDSFFWGDQAVLTLISLWDSHRDKFADPQMKKKQVWMDIATQLTTGGFKTTWLQAETKWKNLTRKYRETVDCLCDNGVVDKYCSYFAELSQVYNYRKTFVSNMKPSVDSTDQTDHEAGRSSVLAGDKRKIDSVTDCTRQYKLRQLSTQGNQQNTAQILESIQKMHNELRDLELEKIRIAKEMHSEKVELFRKLLDAMQK